MILRRRASIAPDPGKIKLGLVCTIGGHFEQLKNLDDLIESYEHFWITNSSRQTTSALVNARAYFVPLGHFKRPLTYLGQVPTVVRILRRERPTHIVSTGSGRTALVPFLLAKIMRVEFLYIDTFSRVEGYSKFGSFLLKLRQPIFSQWEDLTNSRVTYVGPVFKPAVAPVDGGREGRYVLVSAGTRTEPFTRLLDAVDELVRRRVITEHVLVQAGYTPDHSEHLEVFDFCAPSEMEALVAHALFVITQESAGLATTCLKFKIPFIVMPRDYRFGELPAKSDMDEDLHLKLEEMGYTQVCRDVAQLEEAVSDIGSLRRGFIFDNQRALKVLREELEKS